MAATRMMMSEIKHMLTISSFLLSSICIPLHSKNEFLSFKCLQIFLVLAEKHLLGVPQLHPLHIIWRGAIWRQLFLQEDLAPAYAH